jgi:hypothetical protein
MPANRPPALRIIDHPGLAYAVIDMHHEIKSADVWRYIPEGHELAGQKENGHMTVEIGTVTGPHLPWHDWQGDQDWYSVPITWCTTFCTTGEQRISKGVYRVYRNGTFALFMRAMPEMKAQYGRHRCVSIGQIWYTARSGRGHQSYGEPLDTCMCGQVSLTKGGLLTATADRAQVRRGR